MGKREATRERYLRDGLPVRLGGLAANLARVSSCSRNFANSETAFGLVDESKWFIEWTAADFLTQDVETAARLVELQLLLAGWQSGWEHRWSNANERSRLGVEAKAWSDRVLQMSGLLG